MRFVKASNGANYAAIGEIDNADAIIAKLGNEQSLPLQIDRHVIDSAAHVAEQNLGFELKRSLVRRLSGRASTHQDREDGRPCNNRPERI
nr:hypothetical protein [Bradyrhizobium diazoefficiens]